MAKPPTVHGITVAGDARGWCGVPTIGLRATTKVVDVTCKRCRDALGHDLRRLALEIDKRRGPGRPPSTGRGARRGRRLVIRLSVAELENIKTRAKAKALSPATWGRQRLLAPE